MALDHPPLTAAAVETAVRKAYPALESAPSCHRIAEGSEHNVWCVSNQNILRCLPATGRPNGTSEASLRRDAAVSQLLHRYVRKPEIIPEVYSTIKIDGWVGNLERQIYGSSLEATRATTLTEDNLAHLLQDLASVPVEEAMQAVGYAEDRPNMKRRVSKAIGAWTDLIHVGYIRNSGTAMQELLKRKLALLKDSDQNFDQKVLLHADISGEHILVNKTGGALQGVIDWSDAIVGDPCRDIAGLSLAVGRKMASCIGIKASYSQVTVERGLLFAMCLAILNLRDRICGDDDSPVWLLRSQFIRCFEGTSLAHALS